MRMLDHEILRGEAAAVRRGPELVPARGLALGDLQAARAARPAGARAVLLGGAEASAAVEGPRAPSELQVLATCPDVPRAREAIERHRPDVLLVDVHVPVATVLELLATFRDEAAPSVVFVTPHGELAAAPSHRSAARLLQSLDEAPAPDAEAPRGGATAARASRKHIPCVGARCIKLVPLADVEYVKSGMAGVYAVTRTGEFFTDLTLSALEGTAPLLRCHRQYLVNVDHVDEITLTYEPGAAITMRSRSRVPVSRRYLAHVRAALQL
jgi:two-component system LytT family response regulator